MTREHHQAYMEGFGRALLMEDYIEEDDFGERRTLEGKTTNSGVIAAWTQGWEAHSPNMKTDGKSLWHFQTRIGVTKGKNKVAIDYTGPKSVSGSTTAAVNKAKRFADRVVPPKHQFGVPATRMVLRRR